MTTTRLAAAEKSLPGETLADKWAFVQQVGLDGIELAGTRALLGRADELARARDAGVVVSSAVAGTGTFLGDPDPERRRAAIDDLKGLLTIVGLAGGVGVVAPHSFGIASLRMPPFTAPVPREVARTNLVEALREVAEHAAERHVMVLLEPLNRYEDWLLNTLDDAASAIDEVDSPGVGLVADTFHMSIEEASLGEALRRNARHLVHLQLADSNRLEPGAGHLDWREVLTTLDDLGYDGWLAMECRLSDDPARVLCSMRLTVGGRAPSTCWWPRSPGWSPSWCSGSSRRCHGECRPNWSTCRTSSTGAGPRTTPARCA
ncbi:TIM barrel protein [Aestuariimicrobium ganziense]|uniref:TIM barrel protein n=1 Tax=Aestuariimicrobium ganziense TaxID=2773677 RepID=UPI001942670C|nr:sugar phosphate isomerase/epimerase family protein [Aestuariimicrobium ganziense]